MIEQGQKVNADHLKRKAYLYIRQSSLKQVVGNQESTLRQYALKDRAMALGWPLKQIIVIDNDQGHSGAEASDRKGFQYLVAEVGMKQAGLVMGLEVSRLAINSADWHQLVELCALTGTLILDEDGLYNPSDFNDHLILGIKGTMSAAELHILKARLRGGVINKAKRGELKLPLPIGFIYDSQDRVILDPNQQVQEVIGFFFRTFASNHSTYQTVKYFREEGIAFPRKPRTGISKGELMWGVLEHSQALRILHNPRYAGIFYYGRTHQSRNPDGSYSVHQVPKDQWMVFLPESHPGYIAYEDFQRNENILQQNAQAYGLNRKTPPREGPALLQGLVICGKCGQRMTLRYHQRKEDLVPDYVCQSRTIRYASPVCQSIPGRGLDERVEQLLLELMVPLTLEIAMAVQQQIESQLKQAEKLRKQQVAQVHYEVQLARRRFMNVDPENRLVADSLEMEWNEKLSLLRQAEEEYEKKCQEDRLILSEEQRIQMMELVNNFPQLWNDPKTPHRERKRIVRLLIEDVTLIKEQQITMGIRFKGGKTKSLTVPIPQNAFMAKKTPPEIIQQVDQLLETLTDAQIADVLKEKGVRTGDGKIFSYNAIWRIRHQYKLKDRRTRLREKGLLSGREMVKLCRISREALQKLKEQGIIKTQAYATCRNTILYERPDEKLLAKIRNGEFKRNRNLKEV